VSLDRNFHCLTSTNELIIDGGLVQYLLNAKDRNLMKEYTGREDEENVRSYWMALWKRENTGYLKRSHTVENPLWAPSETKRVTVDDRKLDHCWLSAR